MPRLLLASSGGCDIHNEPLNYAWVSNHFLIFFLYKLWHGQGQMKVNALFPSLSPALHLLPLSLFPEEAHQCGKGLLIHCQAGVSRSATIVIAYVMKHTRMTMTDAYKFVKGKRPIISPNLNFMGQLLEFEEDLNNGVTPRILTPKLMGVETVV